MRPGGYLTIAEYHRRNGDALTEIERYELARTCPGQEADPGAGKQRVITEQALASIRVLFRAPDTLDLWGIPYGMRKDVGQQPGDLFRSPHPIARHGWIWLGSPGWYGSMTRAEQVLVNSYVADRRDLIPGNPFEWCEVTP